MSRSHEHERRGPERNQLIPPEFDGSMKLLHWLSPGPKKDQVHYDFSLMYDDHVVRIVKTEEKDKKKHGGKKKPDERFVTPNLLLETEKCRDYIVPFLYKYPQLEMIVTRAMPNLSKLRRKFEESEFFNSSSVKPLI